MKGIIDHLDQTWFFENNHFLGVIMFLARMYFHGIFFRNAEEWQ